MYERYQISDKAADAITYSMLQDIGLITDDNMTYVINSSKVRRERKRRLLNALIYILMGTNYFAEPKW